MRLRNSTCPPASAPCTWNTCLAMSKPIVVACSMDASFGCSTPSPWHTDAVGGRPPHHPTRPPSTHVSQEAGLARSPFSLRIPLLADFVSWLSAALCEAKQTPPQHGVLRPL